MLAGAMIENVGTRQLQRSLARGGRWADLRVALPDATIRASERGAHGPAQRAGGDRTIESGWFARRNTERLPRDLGAPARVPAARESLQGAIGPVHERRARSSEASVERGYLVRTAKVFPCSRA